MTAHRRETEMRNLTRAEQIECAKGRLRSATDIYVDAVVAGEQHRAIIDNEHRQMLRDAGWTAWAAAGTEGMREALFAVANSRPGLWSAISTSWRGIGAHGDCWKPADHPWPSP